MRHNYTVRRSNLVENYDVVYKHIPEKQHVSRIIDHPRKLIIINMCCNPYDAMPEEIFYERTCFDTEEDE